ncbi:MAG: histidine--tRNA ligase [Acholeplasmatales bacterium]|jgi:histidyl-tRNA synthetase|nr:histidine--tRNA ligase [Acholeplasmatales bacterium]
MTKVKGTYDVLPSESANWQNLEAKLRKIFLSFGYQEIRTPIMEYYETIHRHNEDSDMVKKETYDFLDHGERRLTLRPELTAGIIRSYVENKLYVDNDVTRVFYMGANFRYERPQKGRFRQFSQFGVELINASGTLADAEIIILISTILKKLKIKAQININSLGDQDSRNHFKTIIKEYFSHYQDHLCGDCLQRLEVNPLRILDCKVDNHQDFFLNCPKPLDFLNAESQANFVKLQKILDNNQIAYQVNKNLVRGLDYYDELVFEIISQVEGTPLAIGGGGRYNNLVSDLGGPATQAIGFAFGFERVLSCLPPTKNKPLDVYCLFLEEGSLDYPLLNTLRQAGLQVKSNLLIAPLSKLLAKAYRDNPRYIIVVGSDEKAQGLYSLRNATTKEQIQTNLPNLIKIIKENK